MGTGDGDTALDRCAEFTLPDLIPSLRQSLIVLHGTADPLTDTDEMLTLVDRQDVVVVRAG